MSKETSTRSNGPCKACATANGSAVHCTGTSGKSKSGTFDASINPFIHRLSFKTWDKILIAVMSVVILPLRIALAFSFLLLTWLSACISFIGRSPDDGKEPVKGWRRLMHPAVVFWARCMFFAGGFHWVSIKGQRASPRDAPIMVLAPHSSFFDTLVLNSTGLQSIVAKTSAQKVPFFGTLTKFMQPVFVSREDPNSRHSTVAEIRRRAATGGEWPQVVIFAEGTCTNRTCLISFKPGAFIPGVPVQPVCIKYPNNKYDTVTWTWCGIGALKSLWYTVCQLHTRIEIEYLPVYSPSEAEKNDAGLFARNVQAVMAKALGVPTTEHSYEDGEAMLRASELCLPPAPRLVNVNMLLRLARVNVDENVVMELSKSALEFNSKFINQHQFTSWLSKFITPEFSEKLMEVYTLESQATLNNEDSVVDVRLCLLDLYVISKPSSCVFQLLKFVFNVYGGGRVSLTAEEMYDLVQATCQVSLHGLVNSHSVDTSFSYDRVLEFVAANNQQFAEAMKSSQTQNKATKSTRTKVKPECEKDLDTSLVKKTSCRNQALSAYVSSHFCSVGAIKSDEWLW